MLKSLYIENMAIIEKMSIDYNYGFNIFTGETGAGKSIIIGSINFILGNKLSKDIIRYGFERAVVICIFDNVSNKVYDILDRYGLNLNDSEIIIQREINKDGKSHAKICGKPITLSMLKDIGRYLINIHGQHDTYKLFSKDTQLKLLDEFSDTNQLLEDLNVQYKKYSELSYKLKSTMIDEGEIEKKLDILNYQLNEIESSNFIIGEYENLLEQKETMKHSIEIGHRTSMIKLFFDGDDNTIGILEQLEKNILNLEYIARYNSKLSDNKEKLENILFDLKDIFSDVLDFTDIADYEFNDINEIENRLSDLSRIKKKYGPDDIDIEKYILNIKKEIEELNTNDSVVREINEKMENIYDIMLSVCDKIHEKRYKKSKILEKMILNELEYLDMKNIDFKIKFNKKSISKFGYDDIEILIATNKGEELKPITNIASGGEMSRIMLAIKSVLSENEDNPCLIFDEVDTGVSGESAEKIGLKLRSISLKNQVICVTHLAQVAALGTSHFKIKKYVKKDQTFTEVSLLEKEERVLEIARIIGGSDTTNLTLKMAEEMLNSNINL
ncbi:MAG: DNA repair protein RecN [Oscillospiraceae bacterium]|nr:DNA repair protein RecN [Oscillospiraceae bacterium]